MSHLLSLKLTILIRHSCIQHQTLIFDFNARKPFVYKHWTLVFDSKPSLDKYWTLVFESKTLSKTKDIVLYHDYKGYEDPEYDLSKDIKIYDGMHVSSDWALIWFSKQATINMTCDDKHNNTEVLIASSAILPPSPTCPIWFSLLQQLHHSRASNFTKTAQEWIN